jgi:4-amino-4-deoxy-L-arabinose transferase-like glycosyltransferase
VNGAAERERGAGGWTQTWSLACFGLAVRVAVVAWAGARFPTVGDGAYYDTLARRIASGHGYTWLWPDGAVTYVAHYPVGYPALLAAGYALFGARPVVAMVANALVGAFGVLAMHRLMLGATSARRAAGAALVLALHPALVPYTAAVMTEGVTAALLVVAAALGARAPTAGRPWLVRGLAGAVMGVATLVRPQCLALAPVLGLLSATRGTSLLARARAAALVTVVAVAICIPWTLRNCARMDRCALVSVNGGWNLLIGVQSTSGTWAQVDVPSDCRSVWSEAAKDVCFQHAAVRQILSAPARWLAGAPRKLEATFDYFGAAPWYLHLANPTAFDERDKLRLGVVETVASRVLLLAALLAAPRLQGPYRTARGLIALAGAAAALTFHAWVGYLALASCLALLGGAALGSAPLVVPWTMAVIGVTAITHAVFFGAGRYGLVVAPFVGALAFVGGADPRAAGTEAAGGATPMPPEAIESSMNSTSNGSSSRARAT